MVRRRLTIRLISLLLAGATAAGGVLLSEIAMLRPHAAGGNDRPVRLLDGPANPICLALPSGPREPLLSAGKAGFWTVPAMAGRCFMTIFLSSPSSRRTDLPLPHGEADSLLSLHCLLIV